MLRHHSSFDSHFNTTDNFRFLLLPPSLGVEVEEEYMQCLDLRPVERKERKRRQV